MSVKFWVALAYDNQLDFEGHAYIVTRSVGDAHIVKNEVIMCRKSKEALKKGLGAHGHKITTTRPQNVPVCQDCQERYRKDPDLPYIKWVNAVAIDGGKTPKMMGEK